MKSNLSLATRLLSWKVSLEPWETRISYMKSVCWYCGDCVPIWKWISVLDFSDFPCYPGVGKVMCWLEWSGKLKCQATDLDFFLVSCHFFQHLAGVCGNCHLISSLFRQCISFCLKRIFCNRYICGGAPVIPKQSVILMDLLATFIFSPLQMKTQLLLATLTFPWGFWPMSFYQFLVKF